MKRRGFSLVETILYIGLLAILVPSFVTVTLGYIQKSESLDPKIRMEGKASLILSEMQGELLHAQSIDITNSTLEVESSSFTYIDQDGVSVTIEKATDTITFVGGDQDITRLQRTTISGSEWLTDSDISVGTWNLAPVRDSDGLLTGVNVTFSVEMLNRDATPYRDAEFSSQTSIHLEPYVTEL